jgi:hypothetical protein
LIQNSSSGRLLKDFFILEFNHLLPELGVELFGHMMMLVTLGRQWRFQIPIGGFNKKAEILSATEYGKVPI